MSETVIKVQNLSKQYRIGNKEGYKTFRETLVDAAKAPFQKISTLINRQSAIRSPQSETIWALKDVSFEVKQGEVVGIIGRNGTGKSTLLKILSKITEPTEGRVELRGRVGSLLEVGTGFHPELTGHENIYLYGAILGMDRWEVTRKFNEIVAFSELEKFIDTPVKRYSSGMYMRLAFAVAAHLEPEILLVDEVLAVGDVAFQRKCLGKMGNVSKEGRTVLFVSHNMAAIENLCEKAILLNSGNVIRQGDPKQVINFYLETVLPFTIEGALLAERNDRSGNGRIRLTSFHIEDARGNKLASARSGMDMVFVFGFQCRDGETIRNVDIGFSIHSSIEQGLFVLYSSYVGKIFKTVPRDGEFRCFISKLPLSAGHYRVGARVTVGGDEADWPRNGVGYLEVEMGDFYGTGSKGFDGATPILVNGNWSLQGF
jgi:lipopolysaccharide transport system ATP-binding protein